jgi:hypothetical protein
VLAVAQSRQPALIGVKDHGAALGFQPSRGQR